MTLETQSDLAKNPAFIDRVRSSLVAACIAVTSEVDTTPNHANRIAYANAALLEPERNASVVAFGVATNATIDAAGLAATDNDINFVVNSLFDAYAGVA